MLLQRDRTLAPRRIRATGPRSAALATVEARARMPAPSRLPSLSSALQRRAAVFGPYDGEGASPAPLGPWRTLGEAARRAVEAIADRVRS